MLDNLPLELIEKIFDNLSYNCIKNILVVNHRINGLKSIFHYSQLLDYEKIKHLEYSDKFSNLMFKAKNLEIQRKKNGDGNIKITQLIFDRHFNHNIKPNAHILSSITSLIFGYSFNQDIGDILPNSLKKLTFDHSFNKSIKESIPSSVTHLTFGHQFNQDIKKHITNSVIYLTFGFMFNQAIKGTIPKFVKNLKFGAMFN